MLATKTNEISDDEEVARKSELVDQRQLFFEQGANFFGNVARVALAGSRVSLLAQNAFHGLAEAHRKSRKLVAQVRQGELEPLTEPDGVGDGRGQIGEQCGHRRGRFKVMLAIGQEQCAGGIEVRVMPQTGEDIKHAAALWSRVEHAVGRKQWQPITTS